MPVRELDSWIHSTLDMSSFHIRRAIARIGFVLPEFRCKHPEKRKHDVTAGAGLPKITHIGWKCLSCDDTWDERILHTDRCENSLSCEGGCRSTMVDFNLPQATGGCWPAETAAPAKPPRKRKAAKKAVKPTKKQKRFRCYYCSKLLSTAKGRTSHVVQVHKRSEDEEE